MLEGGEPRSGERRAEGAPEEDGASAEAMENGDEWYVRYCEDVLFPFLEAELEEARKS